MKNVKFSLDRVLITVLNLEKFVIIIQIKLLVNLEIKNALIILKAIVEILLKKLICNAINSIHIAKKFNWMEFAMWLTINVLKKKQEN